MSERENTMELEINPYDHLIEPETVPVQSPVIFTASGNGPDVRKAEEVLEMLPLAAEAEYREVGIKEYKNIWTMEFETEDDLLVPDIEPDMEMILNIKGCVADTGIVSENDITYVIGEVKLETLYASAGSYGEPVCVIPATISFRKLMEGYKADEIKPVLSVDIKKIEYRIVNERKYKVRLYMQLNVKALKDCSYKLFDGIKSEPLQLKKEKICFSNVVSCKTKESEIHEELLIKDDKIRPVKILKSDFVISENHRQLAKEKLILNETIWIRILYTAELASKGNLSTQPMLYQGKIDHTQFIAFNKEERDIAACQVKSDAGNLRVEINREVNGFVMDGEISTEICLYNLMEKETVTDFYHLKEEMTCDQSTETICSCVHIVDCMADVRETIDLQNDSDSMRIIHMDARVMESHASVEGDKAVVRGKMQLEVATIDEQDYVCTGRKVCSFECSAVMPVASGKIFSCEIIVREVNVDISGDNKANISAQVSAELNIHEETMLNGIANPCIIRSGNPAGYYPITVYTVKENDRIWDIAKKFKVSEEHITQINKPEDIRAGKKIVIVK